MALPQPNRLRSSRDFSKVYRKGKRAATKNLAIRALKRSGSIQKTVSEKKVLKKKLESAGGRKPSALLLRSKRVSAPVTGQRIGQPVPTTGPRFGISISRKVHKRAVVRNRIKRRLKAIIRRRYMAIAPEWHIVIVVRPPAVECSFDDFLRELEYLLQKLAVL